MKKYSDTKNYAGSGL